MKLTVIIATYGRPLLVNRLIDHLEHQTRLPDEVIVSAPDASHVEAHDPGRLKVSYVFGAHGLTAQRNRALADALPSSGVITFFDDDFLPADDYLERLANSFAANPDWAVITGKVVRDGATDAGYTFEEGLAALREAEAARPASLVVADLEGAYGCNMSVRAGNVGDLRFDERLVLYGWQEDIDFTSQLRRFGKVVGLSTLIGVHLGLKVGKVSGLRFGYSQIVNPIYLLRKGTMDIRFAFNLIGRNVMANVLRSIRPEPYVDRRGRLNGNLLALTHVLRGRIEPEYVLKL